MRFGAALVPAAVLVGAQAVGQTGFTNWETPHVSPIALTPSGARLLAVNTPDNRLEVFAVGAGGALTKVRSIPVGLDPVSVRARTETEAWVVNHVSDSISIVDLSTGRVTRTLFTGDEPADVVFAGAPGAQRAFVSVSQLNQVRVFDPANLGAAPQIVPIQGEDPRSLAVSADGLRVYVGVFESQNATTIVDRQAVSNPTGPYAGLNPPPNNGTLFDPPLNPNNPFPPPVAMIVRKNGAGQWMDGNNRNWSAFVPWNLHDQDVGVIDASTLNVTYARSLMTTVMGLAVSPSGAVTAIGTEATNEVRFEPKVKATFIRVRAASFDPLNPGGPATITDLNPHLTYTVTSVPQATRDLAVGDPRGAAWSPAGDRLFIAGMGSNNVVVTDSNGARLGLVGVGEGPTGVALDGAGATLFVLNKFEGSVSVIDTATLTESSRTALFDPTPGTIKAGRPLLYNTHATSGLGQAGCASCHIDGRTDFLAWDLGDPAGSLRAVNQPCRQGPGNCDPWHPMKGPMVTQSLQGIVQAGSMHWRGDRANLTEFAPAFVGLQGDDAQPSVAQMQQMEAFIATVRYSPNPNRNLDGTLPTSVAVTGGTGNAATGDVIFRTQNTGGGGPTCAACHALPLGVNGQIDSGPGLVQSMKIVQLRGMHEKAGMSRQSQVNNKGFGFNHDSDRDSILALLGPPFNFPPGGVGQQQRRDVEAFMMAFSNDTHAAVGQQVTFDGANNADPALTARLTTLINLANANQVGLVVKGRQGGVQRGWQYVGANTFQSDRGTESTSAAALLASASLGGELTYTAVPTGTQRRIGIDRDADGFLDRDELDVNADPANPASTPTNSCRGDASGDGAVTFVDLNIVLSQFGQSQGAGTPLEGDVNHDEAVNFADLNVVLGDFGSAC